jgi:hypothetical protein
VTVVLISASGFEREEFVGHSISEFHADPEVAEDMLGRMRRGEALHNYEVRLKGAEIQGIGARKSGHGAARTRARPCALAAKELGGSLNVHSDGLGQGATFTLDLPLESTQPISEPETACA